MKLSLISVIAAALLASCASSQLADEPADLAAHGRTISFLTDLGWSISPPVSPMSVNLAPTTDRLAPASPGALSFKNWPLVTSLGQRATMPALATPFFAAAD